MDILSITNVLVLGNDETEILSLQQSLDSYGYQLFFSFRDSEESGKLTDRVFSRCGIDSN